MKTIEDDFYIIGIVLLPVLFFIASFWNSIPNIPCLFHVLTGYYCPGCGGTRAVIFLLRGRFLQSVYYHPVVLYGTSLYVIFMLSQTVERATRHKIRVGMRYRDSYVYILLLLIVINFIVKNYLHYKTGSVL